MNIREQAILRVVKMRGGAIRRIDLIKLLFLVRENLADDGRKTYYGFVPYKFGPYSFAANRDLGKLEERGYLAFPDDRTVKLTEIGIAEDRKMKSGSLAQALAFTDMRTRSLNTEQLLDKVYREHPWFTLNTVRTGWQPPPRPVAAPAIYTVGYGGKQIDDFLNLLLAKGIVRLIDVRSNPVARRYGFHRSTLSALCGHVGIDYVHRPEFGIPGELRRDLDCPAAYTKLFDDYCDETLPKVAGAIKALAVEMGATPSALMCAEEDPEQCHRSRLGAAIAARSGLPVVDITGNNGCTTRR